MISRLIKKYGKKKLMFGAIVAVSIIASIIGFFTLGWVQTFGWIYSVSFAISAIPEAMACIRKGRTDVADGTIMSWISGEIAGLVYGFGLMQWPLIFNCGVNAVFVGIIVYYRLHPRK